MGNKEAKHDIALLIDLTVRLADSLTQHATNQHNLLDSHYGGFSVCTKPTCIYARELHEEAKDLICNMKIIYHLPKGN